MATSFDNGLSELTEVIIVQLNIGSERGPRVESLVRLHNDYVLDLCVCANRTVISSSKDKSIKVWQLQGGKQYSHTYFITL